MTFFVGAILGLTVDTFSASVLCVTMDVFHTFSTLRRTRILKRSFSIRFEWRSMPSRCFWLQFCFAGFALGKLDVLLEIHVTGSGDDGQHFSPLSAAFFRTPPLGDESLVVMPINPQRLLIKTLCLKARVKNNHNTTTTPQQHHNNTTTTPRQHHANTTQTPRKHHANTTQTPRKHHATPRNTTQTPRNTTQTPHKHHSNTTQTPLKHHSNTTQTPHKHHTSTTQAPHKHHTNTTQTPHKHHKHTPQKHHKNTTHNTQHTTHNNHNNNNNKLGMICEVLGCF